VIDPKARTFETQVLWDGGCEFPRVHPDLEGRPHRYTWLATEGAGALGDRGVARFDHHTGQALRWELGDAQIASEPVFVPRPGATDEDDGWAISWVYDAHEHATFAAILDGRAPQQGPVARAWFDHHIPVTFHGNFLAE
jgi:all-trans-8'-apo-beta-carotenal 15,15'-oxygenase